MSYSEPPPPPPQYGAPVPPPAGMPPSNSTKAIIGLVVGILGIFPCCGCEVFSIAAIILGVLARKEIEASNGTQKGAGMAKAAFILGIVGVVLGIVYWILVGTSTINMNYSTSSN